MIYECDQCSTALPAGSLACPKCGETFEDEVPADAVVPARGFSPAESPETDLSEVYAAPAILVDNARLSDEDITTLKSQVLVLKSAVTTLTNRVKVLEMAAHEDKRRFKDHVKNVREALQLLQGSKV